MSDTAPCAQAVTSGLEDSSAADNPAGGPPRDHAVATHTLPAKFTTLQPKRCVDTRGDGAVPRLEAFRECPG